MGAIAWVAFWLIFFFYLCCLKCVQLIPQHFASIVWLYRVSRCFLTLWLFSHWLLSFYREISCVKSNQRRQTLLWISLMLDSSKCAIFPGPFFFFFFVQSILLFTHPPSSHITAFTYSPHGATLWSVGGMYYVCECVLLNRLFLSFSGKKKKNLIQLENQDKGEIKWSDCLSQTFTWLDVRLMWDQINYYLTQFECYCVHFCTIFFFSTQYCHLHLPSS